MHSGRASVLRRAIDLFTRNSDGPSHKNFEMKLLAELNPLVCNLLLACEYLTLNAEEGNYTMEYWGSFCDHLVPSENPVFYSPTFSATTQDLLLSLILSTLHKSATTLCCSACPVHRKFPVKPRLLTRTLDFESIKV